MYKSAGKKCVDWFGEISKISKKLYYQEKDVKDVPIQKPDFFPFTTIKPENLNQMTEAFKSPKDWIEFVLNDFKWEPFDATKEKTPGYPLTLPAAVDEVEVYNLEEFASGIEGLESPELGRYVVATRDLEPGELVLKEKAFSSIVNYNRTKDVCATCKKYRYPKGDDKSEADFLTCDECRSTVFCSEACKEVAMRDYHPWECHYLQRLQTNFRHYTMAFRMVLCNWNLYLKRFIWGQRNLDNNVHAADSDEYDLITNFENLTKKQCFEFALIAKTLMYILKAGGYILRLREEAVEMKNDLLRQLVKLTETKELTKMLKSIVSYQLLFADSSLNKKLEVHLATTIMEHIMRIKCNCFELNSQLVWVKKTQPPTYQHSGVTPIGTVLFLKTSQINHSCKPNCDFFFTGETQNVKTIDYIKKGEELFITYERVGKSMPDREDRIPHLMRSFGFECFCQYCRGSEDLICQSEDDNKVDNNIVEHIDDLVERAEKMLELMRLEDVEKTIFEAKKLAWNHRQFRRVFEMDDFLNHCYGLKGNMIVSTY